MWNKTIGGGGASAPQAPAAPAKQWTKKITGEGQKVGAGGAASQPPGAAPAPAEEPRGMQTAPTEKPKRTKGKRKETAPASYEEELVEEPEPRGMQPGPSNPAYHDGKGDYDTTDYGKKKFERQTDIEDRQAKQYETERAGKKDKDTGISLILESEKAPIWNRIKVRGIDMQNPLFQQVVDMAEGKTAESYKDQVNDVRDPKTGKPVNDYEAVKRNIRQRGIAASAGDEESDNSLARMGVRATGQTSVSTSQNPMQTSEYRGIPNAQELLQGDEDEEVPQYPTGEERADQLDFGPGLEAKSPVGLGMGAKDPSAVDTVNDIRGTRALVGDMGEMGAERQQTQPDETVADMQPRDRMEPVKPYQVALDRAKQDIVFKGKSMESGKDLLLWMEEVGRRAEKREEVGRALEHLKHMAYVEGDKTAAKKLKSHKAQTMMAFIDWYDKTSLKRKEDEKIAANAMKLFATNFDYFGKAMHDALEQSDFRDYVQEISPILEKAYVTARADTYVRQLVKR